MTSKKVEVPMIKALLFSLPRAPQRLTVEMAEIAPSKTCAVPMSSNFFDHFIKSRKARSGRKGGRRTKRSLWRNRKPFPLPSLQAIAIEPTARLPILNNAVNTDRKSVGRERV